MFNNSDFYMHSIVKHVPVGTKTIVDRPNVPWLNTYFIEANGTDVDMKNYGEKILTKVAKPRNTAAVLRYSMNTCKLLIIVGIVFLLLFKEYCATPLECSIIQIFICNQ